MKILSKLKIFGFDKGDKKTLSTWHFKNLSRPALIPWIDFTNFTHEFFFCLKFVSQTFTIHRTAGEGEGYLFNFFHGTKMVRFDWKLKKLGSTLLSIWLKKVCTITIRFCFPIFMTHIFLFPTVWYLLYWFLRVRSSTFLNGFFYFDLYFYQKPAISNLPQWMYCLNFART